MRTDFIQQRDPGDEKDIKRQIVKYDGRLNTGLVKNGDDWTGVFIRGDEVRFKQWDRMIEFIADYIASGDSEDALLRAYLLRKTMVPFVVLDEESQDK